MLKLSDAAALLLAATGALAAGPPEEVRWNDLAARTADRETAIPLAGGVEVAGRTLAVNEDALKFDIRKSSDLRRYARGEALLPRAAIAEVRVLEKRGSKWRAAGAVIGVVGGFVGAMAIGEGAMRSSSNAATYTMFFSVWGGSAVGGYYAGKAADQHWKLLRIAP